MKNKRIAVLLLAAMMAVSSGAGWRVAYAAETDKAVESELKQEEMADGTDTANDTDSAYAEDTEETEREENLIKEEQNNGTATYSDEIQTQASDPVIDSSKKTVTYNEPVDITLDANSPVSSGFISGLDELSGVSGRNITYIYNQPVHITFDGVTASGGMLIRNNRFNVYRFNAPVTIDIKNSNFKQFSVSYLYNAFGVYNGDEKEMGVYTDQKFTVNIENSTVGVFAGGMVKNGSLEAGMYTSKAIDSNCQMDGGIDVTISGKSTVTSLFAGHRFTNLEEKESNNQIFTMKSVNITVNDSTVGNITASEYFAKNTNRANDAKLDGNLNITLENGAKLTSALIGNKCAYGADNAYQCGEVTGTTTFTADSAQTMAQLRNVDLLNLGGSLNIIPASENTGANMTLRDSGMKIDLTNPDQWKIGDVVLAYKYTDGTYPRVDDSKVSHNWTDDSMHLLYEDNTAASTQEWKFKRDTATVTIKEKDNSKEYGDIQVKLNEQISRDQIPETVARKGYEVIGWEKEDGSSWDLEKDLVTGDMTIYPVWKLDKPINGTLEAEGNITTIHTGKSITLRVTANHEAEGTITYSYEWYKDGTVIPSKTRAVQGIDELQVSESGQYSVRVKASDGTLVSEEAEYGPLEITVTDHDFSGEWEKDATNHWHICQVEDCGVRDGEAAHAYGEWNVVREATETEAGSRERTCTVCAYKDTEEIPKLPAAEQYRVTYTFISGTKGQELPDEILKLLPTDEAKYKTGTKVKGKVPAETTVKTQDGVWTFAGYDEEEKVITADTTFTGVWNYKKNEEKTPDNKDDRNEPGKGDNNSEIIKKEETSKVTTVVTQKITGGNVKTGDYADSARYLVLLGSSLMAGVIILFWKKRRVK